MEWSNTPTKKTANVNVDCHKNVSSMSTSPSPATLKFGSASPPSPPCVNGNFSVNPQNPNNFGMNTPSPKKNGNNNGNNQMNQPPIPTMHQLSPMALNNMNMGRMNNMNMNVNMNMNMNMNQTNNAFPAMRNGMPPMPMPMSIPMPSNTSNIIPKITTVPVKSPNTKKKEALQKSANKINEQLRRNMNIQRQMMNPMFMMNGMNLSMQQRQMMQTQVMQRQMLQQQMMMQQQKMAQQNMALLHGMNNMNNTNNNQFNMNNNSMNNISLMPINNMSSNCTLNMIGRQTQNKFAVRKDHNVRYLQKFSELNRTKKMYEDELAKLKSLGKLPSNYKEPSFPDIDGVIPGDDSSPSQSGSPYASILSTSPIEISPNAASVSPPQQPEIAKVPKGEEEQEKEETGNKEKEDKKEEEEQDEVPSPSDFVVVSPSQSQSSQSSPSQINKNNEEKKVNTKENDIVTIVGGRVVFIPPVHLSTQTNDDNNDDIKSNNDHNIPIPVQPRIPNLNDTLHNFGSFNSAKLPDLSSLRSYSISNGFSLRQQTEQKYDLRSSRLKRSRTTFEQRGHSSKKLKSSSRRSLNGSSRGLSGGLRERTKQNGKESKTTLLTLNDISRGDVHVQRGVRKMLRNVNLMRKRSLSCASLSSVKE